MGKNEELYQGGKGFKRIKARLGNKEYFCFRAELSIADHLSLSEDGIITIIPPPGLICLQSQTFAQKLSRKSLFSSQMATASVQVIVWIQSEASDAAKTVPQNLYFSKCKSKK